MLLVDVLHLRKAHRLGTLHTPVLRDVSLGLARGSLSAIVGPSGCGKTTLLTILGGLDRGDFGSVVVDGLDLMTASRDEILEHRRSRVGFVFQFYNLVPSLTALENVEAGLEFLPLGPSARRRRALDYLDRVGLSGTADRFPAQLSGGQQQRVAVARALAREPKLLLADEPTGNLDQEAGEQVFASMRALQRELGVTCVLVTHDAQLAARADVTVHLRDGSVIEHAASDQGSGMRRIASLAPPAVLPKAIAGRR
ncbi:MAG: ABC transporter ATP-binding protein [Labilithrix sp.]|nr:ABC transporter ATP-binding protein [Labilithrix sp.]